MPHTEEETVAKRKRRRPKNPSSNLTAAQRAQLRRKWRRWIDTIGNELAVLLRKRRIYNDLGDVVKANPSTRSPGAFVDWMVTNYVTAICIGVRRLLDKDPRSISFGRLLFEMLQYPGVVSRQSLRAIYGDQKFLADLTFSNIVGRGKSVLPTTKVRSDLRALEDSAERIERFVNKRIAHISPPGAIQRLPTFNELDQILDLLDETMKNYTLLLQTSAPSSFEPTPQYDWQDVLKKPWI
jgi:hypothetical protein